MIRKNIDSVVRDMYEKKSEKSEVLAAIRQRAYDLFSHGKSAEEVISGTLAFAKAVLEKGKVTKEDVEKEIAKVLSINLDNSNKTGLSR